MANLRSGIISCKLLPASQGRKGAIPDRLPVQKLPLPNFLIEVDLLGPGSVDKIGSQSNQISRGPIVKGLHKAAVKDYRKPSCVTAVRKITENVPVFQCKKL